MDIIKMDFIQLKTLCQVTLKFISIAGKKQKEMRIFKYKSRLLKVVIQRKLNFKTDEMQPKLHAEEN